MAQIKIRGVEQRGENSYRLTACCGYDPTGKKLFKKKTIKVTERMTERQLEKYLTEQLVAFQNAVKSGNYFDGDNLTFGEYAAKWFKTAEKELAPTTLHTYKLRVEKRIIPALGHIKLAELKRIHLKAFYESLANEGERLDVYYVPTDGLLKLMSNVKAVTATAKAIGIDPKTLANIRNGKRTKLEIAEKISRHFNTDRGIPRQTHELNNIVTKWYNHRQRGG